MLYAYGGNGEMSERQQLQINRLLERMKTTLSCMLSAFMEMQSGAVHEDALTSAWKHGPRVCYKRGFIVGSYTLPTYYFALQQS